MKFWRWKRRQYPIKRDEDGRSLRQQAFALFDHGYRPAQIYKKQLVAASQKTLFRYFEDWKKREDHVSYRIIRRVMKENPDFTKQMIEALSEHLEMPVEEVIKRMQRPWGLKQALRGQWPDYGLEEEQNENERRLEAALRFLGFAEQFENYPEQVSELLVQILMMTKNTKLAITKVAGAMIIRKESRGKSKTIRLPALRKKTARLLSLGR